MTGRNRNGTFGPGNPGGPGRPPRATEAQYLEALSEAVSLDDWRAIIHTAVTKAKKGDFKAREWLTRLLVGDDERVSELKRRAAGPFGVY
jgi:hypothetical protein